MQTASLNRDLLTRYHAHKNKWGKQQAKRLESQRWELNPRPLAYEASALPLSYVGRLLCQCFGACPVFNYDLECDRLRYHMRLPQACGTRRTQDLGSHHCRPGTVITVHEALVDQWIDHQTSDLGVAGSSPVGGLLLLYVHYFVRAKKETAISGN
jgi:hypothetical protein